MRQDKLDWFVRANLAWDAGRLRSAFNLFMRGAKAGDASCQLDLAYFYDEGIGIKPNRLNAQLWYERAFANGSACAAHNLGLMLLASKDISAAREWFARAIQQGEPDSLYELAKLEIRTHQVNKARGLLKKLLSNQAIVTPSILTKAKQQLSRLSRKNSEKKGGGSNVSKLSRSD